MSETKEPVGLASTESTRSPRRLAWSDFLDLLAACGGLGAVLPLVEGVREWAEATLALERWWPFGLAGCFMLLAIVRITRNARIRVAATRRDQLRARLNRERQDRVHRIMEASKGIAPYAGVPEENRDPANDLPPHGWVLLADAHEVVEASAKVLVQEFRTQNREASRVRKGAEVNVHLEPFVQWLATIGDESEGR